MNYHSDFLIMMLKARKYHSQALTSKALLTLYSHNITRKRAIGFYRRMVFKKFFKKRWKNKYV